MINWDQDKLVPFHERHAMSCIFRLCNKITSFMNASFEYLMNNACWKSTYKCHFLCKSLNLSSEHQSFGDITSKNISQNKLCYRGSPSPQILDWLILRKQPRSIFMLAISQIISDQLYLLLLMKDVVKENQKMDYLGLAEVAFWCFSWIFVGNVMDQGPVSGSNLRRWIFEIFH